MNTEPDHNLDIDIMLIQIDKALKQLEEFDKQVRFFRPHFSKIIDLVEEFRYFLSCRRGRAYALPSPHVHKNSSAWFELKNLEHTHSMCRELKDMVMELEGLMIILSKVASITMVGEEDK